MKSTTFPERFRRLERFSERFEAFRLRAGACDVLFASYPPGTRIEPHAHAAENWGVVTKGAMTIAIDGRKTEYRPGEWYHIPAGAAHAARCDADTEEIEFWFRAG